MVDDPEKEQNVSNAILSALKDSGTPLTFVDLLEKLGDRDFSISSVKRALAKLQEDSQIIALPEATGTQGRPKYVYKSNQNVNGETTTMAQISEKKEQSEHGEDDTVMKELVSQTLGWGVNEMPENERRKIYRETAQRLMSEDPRKLAVEYAKWLRATYGEFFAKLTQATSERDKDQMKKALTRLKAIGRRVFNQWFGVPWDVPAGEEDDSTIPFRLLHSNNAGDLSKCNEELLQMYVNWSIVGETFLELVEVSRQNRPLRIGGSDSSSYWVDIGRLLPWNSPSKPFALITAVGARYDINKKVSDHDINPDPKVLAQYSRKRAIDEGYLITPEMLQDEENFAQRIREAALDLRQYVKDYEVLFEKGTTHVHFRDGRIFPVEHRFSDALHYGDHGEMVRRGLAAFSNLVSRVGSEEGRVLLCGYVKRVNLDVIAPMVIWYMAFESGKKGSQPLMKMTPLQYTSTPQLREHSDIVNYLFSAISDLVPEDRAVVTFRSIRRFQSMQEDNIMNSKPTEKREIWQQLLGTFSKSINEDYKDDAVSNYSFLTAKASVLTFYSSKPSSLDPRTERDIMIPRIETLVPYLFIEYPSGKQPERIVKFDRDVIPRIVSVITDPEVLDVYQDDLMPYDTGSPKIFMVPKPVCRAHETSKEIAKLYSGEMLVLLAREIKAAWLQHQAKGL